MSVKVYLDGELVTTADEGTVSLWSKQVAPIRELRIATFVLRACGPKADWEPFLIEAFRLYREAHPPGSFSTTYPMNPPIPVVRGEAKLRVPIRTGGVAPITAQRLESLLVYEMRDGKVYANTQGSADRINAHFGTANPSIGDPTE